MASPNDSNANNRSAEPEETARRVHDGNVRHLARSSHEAREQADAVGPAELESKSPPLEGRRPEIKPIAPAAVAAGEDPAGPKTSRLRLVLFALLPIALIAGGYVYVTGGTIMSTDNAYVQADTVGVSTDISGIVSQVSVHDNQQVAVGDVLFKLDDLQFRLALDRAEAQLETTRNDLKALQTSYKDTQSQIEQAKADIDFNTANFKRQQQLAANSYSPQATLDASYNTLQAAQHKLASLNQQLAGIAANLNGSPDAPVEEHPRYKNALAARDEAARQLSHTVVRAPFAGIVTNVPSLQPGQYLAAATTAFNIVSTDHVWVEASPKETELTNVEPGQKVTIDVDTYPGRQWVGTVESISPASASSFSLLPAENTSGNWVKVVQRIPMRIRVDNAPGKPPLRVGMSVEVNVDTGRARGLPSFVTDLFGMSGAERG